MSDIIKYTPEQVIAEAQRCAGEEFHNGVIELDHGNLSDMIGHLPEDQFRVFI